MPEESEPAPSPAPPPRRRARWFVVPAAVLGVLLATGAALFFWLTSDTGVRGVLLPRLSKKLGVEVAATRVAWSPFSSIEVEGLRVGPAARPLLEATRFSARYPGWATLRGGFSVSELAIESPAIHLVEKPDGTLADVPAALQPAPSGTRRPAPSPATESAPAPLPFAIGRLEVRNLRFLHEAPHGRLELGPVNLSAQDLRAGGPAALDLDLGFNVHQELPGEEGQEAHATTLSGHASSKLAVELDDAFFPRSARGEIAVNNLVGHAGSERFEGFSATLRFDLGPNPDGKGQLREAILTVENGGAAIATARASGPLDLPNREAEIDLQVGPVDKAVLNLLFGARHMDFGPTKVGYSGHVSVRQGGTIVRAEGRLVANPLVVSAPHLPAGTAPPIQVALEHGVEVDLRARRATLSRLSIDAARATGMLLRGALNRPMTLSWKEGETLGTPAEDAEFQLQLLPLDIAPFLPLLDLPPGWRLGGGTLAATLKVTASEQGHLLSFDGRVGAVGVTLATPHISFADATAQITGRASLRDLKTLRFDKNSLRFTEKGEEIAEVTLDGSWDFPAHTGMGRTTLSVPLPTLLGLRPVAGLAIPSGSAAVTADWKLDAAGRFVARTTTVVREVTAAWQGIRYTHLGAQLDALVGWGAPELRANDARLSLLLDGQPVGALLVTAGWNARTGAARARFEAGEWRPAAFAPLLATWLPGRELRSLLLSGQGDLTWDAGVLSFSGKADARNLLLAGGDTAVAKPLNAGLSAEATWNTNGTLVLRSAALQLDPVGKAKNRIEASGTVRSTPTLLFADLKFTGQALDLTPWHEQLSTTNAPPATPPPAAAPSIAPAATAASSPTAPPTPRPLDLTLDVKVDSLKVREFTMANLSFPLRIKGDVLEITDAHATLGAATLTATARSEKGEAGATGPFRFESKVENLALGPLVDTLAPSLRGQVSGTLTARAYGSGRGLSRHMLERNLDGNLELAIRTAHLEKIPGVKKALSRLGGILQSPDITASTIEDVDGSAKIATGKLHTDNLHAKGTAIEVTVKGDAFFDQRLAMEGTLKMQRASMAKSALLAPIIQLTSSEQGDWIRIPGGAAVTGTLAEPQIAIDTSKFAKDTLINTGVNVLKQFLQKKQEPPAQPPQPDQPAAPAQPQPENPVQNLLDNFLKRKK